MPVFEKVCAPCGTTFVTRRSTKKFCTYKCSCVPGAKSAKAPNGSGSVNAFGYRVIRVGGKRVLEHRYVMSLHVGRELADAEVVHHIDGNKLNNSVSNLAILPSQSVHKAEHVKRFASETHKECSLCCTVKPRSEFSRRGNSGHNKDPHQAYCRPCAAIRMSEYRNKRKRLPALPCADCKSVTLSCRTNCGQLCSRCYRAKYAK